VTALFGYRVRYTDGLEIFSPFLPEVVTDASEIEPVVFGAKAPFYIDDRFPNNLVVRREGAPEDVWWPLTQAIQLGLATTTQEWHREVPSPA
jgi:hypothetical protein